MTENLSWDTHIDATCTKAHRTLGFLRRNIRECTPEVKAGAYKAMVRPILDYASTVWDPTQAKKIGELEQVQRRAARFVYNDYRTRTPGCVTNMLRDLDWNSLEERRRQSRLTMMFKIQHQLVDINPDLYCRKNDARTRGQQKLFQERIHDPILRDSFFARTARDWNLLPTSTVTASSAEAFKSLLNL